MATGRKDGAKIAVIHPANLDNSMGVSGLQRGAMDTEPAAFRSLVLSYKQAIDTGAATTYEDPLKIPQNFAAYLNSVSVMLGSFTDGDYIDAYITDTNDTIKVTIADAWCIKAANFQEVLELVAVETLDALDKVTFRFYNHADQDKSLWVNIEYLVPDDFILIGQCENTLDWDDDQGATRAGGSALTATFSTETTILKQGLASVKHAILLGNLAANAWGRQIYDPAGEWKLDDLTTLKLYYYNTDADMQDLCIILEDNAGNYSYWTQTPTAAATWTELSCTLASPTGSSATAADLARVTKVIVATQQKATAVDFDVYIDGIHVV